jgi:hypothetical protein
MIFIGMKKYLSYLFVCLISIGLLFTACSKSNSNYDWTTMTKDEVSNFLVYSNHVNMTHGPIVNAAVYCIPTVKWVNKVYGPELQSFLFKNNVDKYIDNDNTCINFSAYGEVAGYMLHLKGEGPRHSSLAIGIVDYIQTFYSWHSINFFVARDDNNKLIIYYFEPQNQTEVSHNQVDTDWVSMRL